MTQNPPPPRGQRLYGDMSPGQPPSTGVLGMRPIPGASGESPEGRPRETSTLAVIAFVLSLFGTTLISFGLGLVALKRMPSRNQKGKGWAIAAMVISVAWIVPIVALVLRDSPPPTVRPAALNVGDCVKSLTDADLSAVTVVPCSGPNGGEVYAVFELTAGNWPGEVAVQANGRKGCNDRWLASKRQADERSEVHFVYPTEANWNLVSRRVTCLLTPPM
ncbi:DUF4190 domain-containing protein [Kribbella antibiotica]|uniref:DUF4190 domain-containing protein n=1 Tax=Kribbella antibiotica TaxID=190195 RepID=A0A4R4YL61_9ACTN|nr:DUF4190 domain-containing protein [Kribbella antibiotica]TDD45150.1 DUF4190 domain-containing protein [Kribbella antibiotica]